MTLQPHFLASALGDCRHSCDGGYLNRTSSQALDRKLHGVIFAVEWFIDNRGQVCFRFLDACDPFNQRRITEGEDLGAVRVPAKRDSVEQANYAVRLVAAVDLERVAGMRVFRRANILRERLPDACRL